MTVLTVILLYLSMGASTAFIALVVAFRGKWDNTDRQLVSTLSFIFWPLLLPAFIVGFIINLMTAKAREVAERW